MTAMNDPTLSAVTQASARRARRLLLGVMVAFITLPLLLLLFLR